MPITMQGISDLAKTQKLIISDAPPRGKQKCFNLKSFMDAYTAISVRCKIEKSENGKVDNPENELVHMLVENIAISIPATGVPRYAIKRNAFIMTALLKAAMPEWAGGYNWLIDNMRRLGHDDRYSHSERGVTVSLDRWTHGTIRMTIGGL